MKSSMASVLIAACASATLLCACAGAPQPGTPPISPFASNGVATDLSRGMWLGPDSPIVGVYVSEYGAMNVLEYDYQGTGNPLCTLSLSGNVTSVQSDSKNELIVPESTGVNIYKERRYLCLSVLPIKQFPQITNAIDGVSPDGRTYYFDLVTGVAVCKWGTTPSCPRTLTNPYARDIEGITADATGVYASAGNGRGGTSLIYWPGGKGHGIVLNGFVNYFPGGLYLDGFGNLLSIEFGSPNGGGPALYVYSGCPSACTAHGPFSLGSQVDVEYGSLGNGDATFMALVEDPVSEIDVYQYNGTNGIKFLYSNSDGLSVSNGPVGIAQLLN